MKQSLTTEQMKDIYESEEYTENYHQDPGERIERIISRIKFDKNDVVLDCACGNGLLLDLIHTKVKKFVGVDYSQKFISIAKERQEKQGIKNAEFICEEASKFCNSNKSKFDKAFALDFAEHFGDKEAIKIFTAIKESLKPEGRFYLHTPNADFIIEKMKAVGIMKQTSGHIGIRNGEEYINLLSSIGFSKVEVNYLPHYLGPLKAAHLFSSLPLIGRLFKARLFIVCLK